MAGYGWGAEEMIRAGRRVFYLKRLINYRYGLTAEDDDLTPRLLEPARDGDPAEESRVNFTEMKEKFYDLMGMDPETGVPSPQALVACGMGAELLEKIPC